MMAPVNKPTNAKIDGQHLTVAKKGSDTDERVCELKHTNITATKLRLTFNTISCRERSLRTNRNTSNISAIFRERLPVDSERINCAYYYNV